MTAQQTLSSVARYNPISAYQPLPWQIPPLLDLNFILLLTGSAGGGKALALNTELPTPDGIKTIGEIRRGHWVYDCNLNPVQVKATSPVYHFHHCFELTFEQGQVVVCDAGHLWFVRLSNDPSEIVLTTHALSQVWGEIFVKSVTPLGGSVEQRVLSIKPHDPVPVMCIEVANEKGDFLITEQGIVTHNSRLAAEKVHAYLKKYPGTMGLMVRKQRQSMTNSTVLFYERTVVGPDPSVKHFPSKLRFEYDNGSILAYGGMDGDEQKEQIRSIGQEGALHIVWIEEANRFTEEDFNEIMARMRGAGVFWIQIILSTNPDAPTHWIYRRLILKKEASVYYSKAVDNPHNPPSYVGILKRMTGVTKLRLSEGRWVQAEGVVYEDFSPENDRHVIDAFDIPASWPRYISIDFGITAPFVALWFAYSESNDRLYCYREIYMTRRTVRKHALKMWELVEDEEYEAIICDHDAEDRLTLEEEGFPNVEAYKDIDRGLQLTMERMKVREDNKPGIQFFRDMLVEVDENLRDGNRPISTLEEFNAYVWARATDGSVKNVPQDKNNHGLDCLRYMVAYLDSGQGAGAEFVLGSELEYA